MRCDHQGRRRPASSLGCELGLEIVARMPPVIPVRPRTIKTRCRGWCDNDEEAPPYLQPTGVLRHYYRVVWADHNICDTIRTPLVLRQILAVRSSFRLLRGRISGVDVWTDGFVFIIE